MWTKIKQFILDLVFPVNCLGCKKQGEILCLSCIEKIPLKQDSDTKFNLIGIDKIITGVNYYHPVVKQAVHAFKYPPYSTCICKNLSKLLIKALEQSPDSITYLSNNLFVLVPIPLSKTKLAKRGFNQAELIAKQLHEQFKWPINTNLLKKVKNTRSQTDLPYKERKINVKHVFCVLQHKIPKNIILIDDVFTTGATLEQAGQTLRKAGVKKIWAIVLAKT